MQPRQALTGGQILVEGWLARKRAAAVVLRCLSAIALLALASVVLTIIFFFTYAVVWFGYNYGVSAISELILSRRQHISHSFLSGQQLNQRATACGLFWSGAIAG